MMADWIEREIERPYHPVAALFPLLEGPEFEELKADVAANGLLEAIWLHPDGSIIDGRNRHRACIETETQPTFRTWDSGGSPLTFVVSMNLHRRHLSSSQRAAITPEVIPMLEAEAKERQATSGPGVYGGKPLVEQSTQAVEGKSRDQAATLFGTNSRYVQIAKGLAEEAPDLLEEVKQGAKTMPAANWELKQRQRQKSPPLPVEGKYRIFYADPPWQYSRAELDDYGHTRRHYPSMSIDELCMMGSDIQQMAERDAVLFLWVTSPMLKNCWRIFDAWGFEYKTSFVWDKVRHNFGHYNSVRHEFLLIATRGICTPDVKQLFDSVQSVERSDEHSEKPEEFREIIETIYTHGNRIELFGRKEHENWLIWGNEPDV